MFEGLFKDNQSSTTATATLPTANKNMFVRIFDNKKAAPVATAPQPVKTATLPDYLGGGQYKTSGPGSLIESKRSQETLPSKSAQGEERDHIVPVALGGTSEKNNLQYLKNNAAGQQEGKTDVEFQAIEDYRAGKISLPQARLKILSYNQKLQDEKKGIDQDVADNFIPAVKDIITNKFTGFIKSLFSKKPATQPVQQTEKTATAPIAKPSTGVIGLSPTNLPQPENQFLKIKPPTEDDKKLPIPTEEKITNEIKAYAKTFKENPAEAGVYTFGGLTKGVVSAAADIVKTGVRYSPLNLLSSYRDTKEQSIEMFDNLKSNFADLITSPEEEFKRVEKVGEFIGELVPYAISDIQALKTLDSARKFARVNKLFGLEKTLVKYSAAVPVASFIATGQVLHQPEDGSRVKQMLFDLTTLGAFKLGEAGLSKLSKVAQDVISRLAQKTPVLKDELELVWNELKTNQKGFAKIPGKVDDPAITEIGQKIENLAKEKYTPYEAKKISLFEAQPKTIAAAKKIGLKVDGYTHEVDNYAIRHALNEHKLDPMPLTEADLKLIPDIIKNADDVKYTKKTKLGLNAFQYTKRYNGTTYYIEEARTGKKTLSFKTMYKTKTPSGASLAREELGAVRPPLKEAAAPNGVNNIKIAKETQKVNTTDELFQREQDLVKREVQFQTDKEFKFSGDELENQYQSFKPIIRKIYGTYDNFLGTVEDLGSVQAKASKKGISGSTVDNLVYSQENTGDEILQMFKDRLSKEVSNKGEATYLSQERIALNKERAATNKEEKIQQADERAKQKEISDEIKKNKKPDIIVSTYAAKEIKRLENLKNGYSHLLKSDPESQLAKEAVKRYEDKINHIKLITDVTENVNAQKGNISKELLDSYRKITENNRVEKIRDIEATSEKIVPSNKSLWQKMTSALQPVKSLDTTTQRIYRNKVRADLEAKELANKMMEKFPKTGDIKTIIKYQGAQLDVEMENNIKKIFDDLYDEARKKGFDIPYKQSYLPQVYRESEPEVKDAFSRYLKDQGVEQTTIDAYLAGEATLPQNIAKNLMLKPFMTKVKIFPDYITALEYGLTPRFTEINQLVAHYKYQLDLAINNKAFLDELLLTDKIRTAEKAGQGWRPLELSFHPAGYFARPDLAKVLNSVFKPDELQLGLGHTAAKIFSGVSRGMQEIVLSAGIPFTNINFFAIGQLVKNLTENLGGLNAVGAYKNIVNFVRSNFNKASIKWLNANMDTLAKMAKEGIDVSNRVGNYKGSYNKFWQNLKRQPGATGKLGFAWDKMFQEKTFNSFMAQNLVQTFKDAEKSALKKMSPEEAQKFAGEVTKTFYGLIDDVGRSDLAKNVLSAVFFAPTFREGIIRTMFNSAKSITTEFFNPAFNKNRKLIVGMILSYTLYNVLNKKTSGHYMWDNPAGKEFELMIPRENGEVIYTPFMPSFLSFPRNMASGAIATVKGDFPTATQKFGSLTSMPIALISQILANKDYFGRQIYDPQADKLTMGKQMAGYIFGISETGASGGLNHPFIRELVNQLYFKNKPLYQSVSEAMELPFKFSSMSKIAKQEIIQAQEEKQRQNKKVRDAFKPRYDEVVNLIEAGNIEGAKQATQAMTPEDYKIYKYWKSYDKKKDSLDMQVKIKPVFDRVQELLASGDMEEAKKVTQGLTKEEYAAYTALKNKIGK